MAAVDVGADRADHLLPAHGQEELPLGMLPEGVPCRVEQLEAVAKDIGNPVGIVSIETPREGGKGTALLLGRYGYNAQVRWAHCRFLLACLWNSAFQHPCVPVPLIVPQKTR